MRALKLSLAAVIALSALAAILVKTGGPTTAPPGAGQSAQVGQAPSHDSSHQRPASRRSLKVATRSEPAPSARPDRMRALLLDGKLPAGVVTATVLTDEDCAPDADGVSHCRNRLRLPNGKTIEVRHPHRMHDVPCMTPGEKVRIGRAVEA